MYVVLLEDFNADEVRIFSEKDHIVFHEDKTNELVRNFSNLKEPSSKEELVQHMRRSVLVKSAESLNCAKVFTGENGTVLAIELLAGVAGGGGGTLPYRVGFRDTRHTQGDDGTEDITGIKNGVTILRPMRDVSSKEVALYTTFHQLETNVSETFGTGEDSLYSIKKLTEDFLVGLQDGFPATIPTIFKTGDKLSMPGDGDVDGRLCCLCSGPLDTTTDQHNALQATMFSSLVSAKGKRGLGDTIYKGVFDEANLGEVNGVGCQDKADECCGQGDGSCKSSKVPVLSLKELLQSLCYSCRRTFEKIKKVEDLPVKLQKKVGVISRREKMKEEINDFLL